jgi:uncharacterized protein YcbK (DUF882 family)
MLAGFDWAGVEHFTPAEFACRGQNCCGNDNLIQPALVFKLDQLRGRLNKPVMITSGYRCPIHNSRVSPGTGETGPHTTGLAADIGVSGRDAITVLRLALELGFTGIGVQQKGGDRFLHVDLIPDSHGHKRPWIWSY